MRHRVIDAGPVNAESLTAATGAGHLLYGTFLAEKVPGPMMAPVRQGVVCQA